MNQYITTDKIHYLETVLKSIRNQYTPKQQLVIK